jgi:hypothetical protein
MATGILGNVSFAQMAFFLKNTFSKQTFKYVPFFAMHLALLMISAISAYTLYLLQQTFVSLLHFHKSFKISVIFSQY